MRACRVLRPPRVLGGHAIPIVVMMRLRRPARCVFLPAGWRGVRPWAVVAECVVEEAVRTTWDAGGPLLVPWGRIGRAREYQSRSQKEQVSTVLKNLAFYAEALNDSCSCFTGASFTRGFRPAPALPPPQAFWVSAKLAANRSKLSAAFRSLSRSRPHC